MHVSLETMPFGNGAGTIKFPDQVMKASRGPMSRITVGSITAKPRDGNSGDVYYFHPQKQWSLNSLGLPNPGMEVYKKWLPAMVDIAHGTGKTLWASISPFSPEECGEMAQACLEAGVDGVEINGSCPNVYQEGRRKAIPALDPSAAEEMFRVLGRYVESMDRISFKLSPTRDKHLLSRLAVVFNTYDIRQLVCCNAKADQEGTRVDGKPALAFRSSAEDQVRHQGGLGGSKVFTENLRVAKAMRGLMPEADIIGIGGILTGVDAELYLELGCIGFQSTTGYLEFGNHLFVEILMHLSDKVLA